MISKFAIFYTLLISPGKNELGHPVPDTKAQIMSRRVWEILLLLPTNPEIKSGLQEVDTESDMTSLGAFELDLVLESGQLPEGQKARVFFWQITS